MLFLIKLCDPITKINANYVKKNSHIKFDQSAKVLQGSSENKWTKSKKFQKWTSMGYGHILCLLKPKLNSSKWFIRYGKVIHADHQYHVIFYKRSEITPYLINWLLSLFHDYYHYYYYYYYHYFYL